VSDDEIIEEIEDVIPDERKNLSFGGPDEGIIDVLEDADKRAHERGAHEGDERADCPLCDTEGDR
jgi:hypothetical protein